VGPQRELSKQEHRASRQLVLSSASLAPGFSNRDGLASLPVTALQPPACRFRPFHGNRGLRASHGRMPEIDFSVSWTSDANAVKCCKIIDSQCQRGVAVSVVLSTRHQLADKLMTPLKLAYSAEEAGATQPVTFGAASNNLALNSSTKSFVLSQETLYISPASISH